jgi:hypothetical protein
LVCFAAAVESIAVVVTVGAGVVAVARGFECF